jgi:hypothetical protein
MHEEDILQKACLILQAVKWDVLTFKSYMKAYVTLFMGYLMTAQNEWIGKDGGSSHGLFQDTIPKFAKI